MQVMEMVQCHKTHDDIKLLCQLVWRVEDIGSVKFYGKLIVIVYEQLLQQKWGKIQAFHLVTLRKEVECILAHSAGNVDNPVGSFDISEPDYLTHMPQHVGGVNRYHRFLDLVSEVIKLLIVMKLDIRNYNAHKQWIECKLLLRYEKLLLQATYSSCIYSAQ
jgi:hypothetical protein